MGIAVSHSKQLQFTLPVVIRMVAFRPSLLHVRDMATGSSLAGFLGYEPHCAMDWYEDSPSESLHIIAASDHDAWKPRK